MSGDGSNPNAIQDGAKELLKKPLISSQTYWILYIVNRRPVEDSTYHVKKHSTEIPVLTKPDDEKNLMNALKQFRTREAPKILKQHKDAVKITVLRTYLDYEKAEKDAKNYNNQYAESKKINQRIQSNKRRLV
ncbi:MAG: hypothetical protein ABSA11_03305 [Candidatus Bathyarchaeia archaeon]|jgi:hypothetical protein